MESTKNLADEIESVVGEEPIEAVVLHRHYDLQWSTEEEAAAHEHYVPPEHLHTPISWETARPYLDYKRSVGFGGAYVHPFWLWTPTRVLFIAEYDGANWIEYVPRHPRPGAPQLSGGES